MPAKKDCCSKNSKNKKCCKKGHKNCKKDHGGSGAMLLSVALGAALAAGAGYYATHKEEVDREAKKKINELSKLYKETRSQIEPKVMKVWGEVSEDAVATYMDVRGTLLHALEDERVQNAGGILKENYETIVNTVVKSAKKSGMLDAKTQKKLEELFKTDWSQVKDILMAGAEVASKAAQKGAKKAGRVAKKAVKKASLSAVSKKAAVARHKKTGVAKKKAGAKKKSTAKKTTKKKSVIRKPAKKAAKKTTKRTKKK